MQIDINQVQQQRGIKLLKKEVLYYWTTYSGRSSLFVCLFIIQQIFGEGKKPNYGQSTELGNAWYSYK